MLSPPPLSKAICSDRVPPRYRVAPGLPLERRRRTAAHHELRRDGHPLRGLTGLLHELEQQAQAAAPHLAEVLAHRGERRREVLGLWDVVEADDAHLARDLAPALVQRAQDTEGHLVVGHEDGAHLEVA